jgi:UDP-N-acetylglucosamine acyltransferase
MTTTIHPTAVIEKGAMLGADVRVGAYCVVGSEVALGDGVTLHSHVCIAGRTTVGARTAVYPFASLGYSPQDLKYHGEPSTLEIGTDNVIREHVTMNPGTEGGGMVTRVGNGCLFMVGVHVAHDCLIGDVVIMANNATLAGHVQVGDAAVIGGLAAVHQFVRIGANAMIGGLSAVEHDVIPFGSVMGERAHLSGLNLVGMKRRGFSRESIHTMRALYREVFEASDNGTLQERASALRATTQEPEALQMLDFVLQTSKRSICVPAAGNRDVTDI